jgi:hypothetical protein
MASWAVYAPGFDVRFVCRARLAVLGLDCLSSLSPQTPDSFRSNVFVWPGKNPTSLLLLGVSPQTPRARSARTSFVCYSHLLGVFLQTPRACFCRTSFVFVWPGKNPTSLLVLGASPQTPRARFARTFSYGQERILPAFFLGGYPPRPPGLAPLEPRSSVIAICWGVFPQTVRACFGRTSFVFGWPGKNPTSFLSWGVSPQTPRVRSTGTSFVFPTSLLSCQTPRARFDRTSSYGQKEGTYEGRLVLLVTLIYRLLWIGLLLDTTGLGIRRPERSEPGASSPSQSTVGAAEAVVP